MKTRITFPFHIVGADSAKIAALLEAAGVSLAITSIETQGNVLIVTADRLLTAQEKTLAAAAFRAAYPRIEDVA